MLGFWRLIVAVLIVAVLIVAVMPIARFRFMAAAVVAATFPLVVVVATGTVCRAAIDTPITTAVTADAQIQRSATSGKKLRRQQHQDEQRFGHKRTD